eukprot:s128_g26.t1
MTWAAYGPYSLDAMLHEIQHSVANSTFRALPACFFEGVFAILASMRWWVCSKKFEQLQRPPVHVANVHQRKNPRRCRSVVSCAIAVQSELCNFIWGSTPALMPSTFLPLLWILLALRPVVRISLGSSAILASAAYWKHTDHLLCGPQIFAPATSATCSATTVSGVASPTDCANNSVSISFWTEWNFAADLHFSYRSTPFNSVVSSDWRVGSSPDTLTGPFEEPLHPAQYNIHLSTECDFLPLPPTGHAFVPQLHGSGIWCTDFWHRLHFSPQPATLPIFAALHHLARYSLYFGQLIFHAVSRLASRISFHFLPFGSAIDLYGCLIATSWPFNTSALPWCCWDFCPFLILGVGSLIFSLALATVFRYIYDSFIACNWTQTFGAQLAWCDPLLLAQSIALEIVSHRSFHLLLLPFLLIRDIALHTAQFALWGTSNISAQFDRIPGPKSRGIHCSSVRLSFLLLLSCISMTEPQWYGCWGEGSMPAMGHREALLSALHSMHHPGAKPHGLEQQAGIRLSETKKRAFRRACRRSLEHGHAWYQGHNFTPDDFPSALRASVIAQMQKGGTHSFAQDGSLTKPPSSCNHTQAPKKRLKVFSWNPSGLSGARYQEFLHWLTFQHFDVICLAETRWRSDMEWLTDAWTCVHTGDSNGHSGVLLMVARSFCSAPKLSWQVIQNGRILHARLHNGLRHYDLVGVYQWPHNHQNKPKRQALFAKLDDFLQQLPKRNLLALMGDFNTSVRAFGGVAGTSFYTWQNQPTEGASHSDSGAFEQLLMHHDLCVLNAWNQKDGPTFLGPMATSRIDFIICRQKQMDGMARDTSLLRNMPMIPASCGHVPVVATLLRCWIPYKPAAVDHKFTFQHRMLSRHLHMHNDPAWMTLLSDTQQKLHHVHALQQDQQYSPDIPASSPCRSEEHLVRMHAVLSDSFHDFVTAQPKLCKQPASPDLFQTTVECKWKYWHHLKSLHKLTLSNLFSAWKCWAKFSVLGKSQTAAAKQRKIAKVKTLTQQAGCAAARHDLFKLYQLVNRFTPKQKRSRIQLRTSAGGIASPTEELAILRAYVKRIWHDPVAKPILPLCHPTPPGVPFTQLELANALRQAPVVKAVAQPFPPNLLWRNNADAIAAIVHQDLQKWWNQWPPHVPSVWQRGWLVFIGKPNRKPNAPENLRALAMQEPVGKAILQLLTSRLQCATFATLSQYPQMAYMRARDTQDAVIRVVSHCLEVKRLFQTQTNTLRNHLQGTSRLSCYGGIQMFVDLEKAFDMAPRAEVIRSLLLLQVPSSLIALFAAWHEG